MSLASRKKPITYGRRSTARNKSAFINDDDGPQIDERIAQEVPGRLVRSSPLRLSNKKSIATQPDSRPVASSSPVKKTIPAKDEFDFPSSEDEVAHKPLKKASLGKPLVKRVLFQEPNQATPGIGPSPQHSDGVALETVHVKNLTASDSTVQSPKSASKPAKAHRLSPAVSTPMSARERLLLRQGNQTITNEAPAPSISRQNGSSNIRSLAVARSEESTPSKGMKGSRSPSKASRVVRTTDEANGPARSAGKTMSGKKPSLEPIRDVAGISTPPDRPVQSSKKVETPPSRASTPGSAVHHTTLTPKQSALWDDLFNETNDGGVDAQSAASNRSHKRRKLDTDANQEEVASNQQKRMRMVEHLKSARRRSSSNSSTDEDAQDEDESSLRESSNMTPTLVDTRLELVRRSQSQHIPAIVASGSRLTYNQERSHLTETSLEDMFNESPLPIDPRPSPRNRRTAAIGMKQRSEFEMDLESDEDDTPNKPRPVHELRAKGKATRIGAQIEDLLTDTALSRRADRRKRQTALMEVTSRMLDEDFRKHFLQHGSEQRLFDHCDASGDLVSQCLLVATSAVILSTDLPPLAVTTLASRLPGMCKLLHERAGFAIVDAFKHVESVLSKVASFVWDKKMPSVCSPRLLYLQCLDLLIPKARELTDAGSMLQPKALEAMCDSPALNSSTLVQADDDKDGALVVSILESFSTTCRTSSWPVAVTKAVASLPARFDTVWHASPQTIFLAFRLCLNVSNDESGQLEHFAQAGSIAYLMTGVTDGFAGLDQSANVGEKTLALDLLVLAIGILINLSEYSEQARKAMAESSSSQLFSLIKTFHERFDRAFEAASEEETTQNVAYGYLAILLANLCQEPDVRLAISSRLPEKRLDMLIRAVEEFVSHHQKVDKQTFDGAEGQAVLDSFTERLRQVSMRLRELAV